MARTVLPSLVSPTYLVSMASAAYTVVCQVIDLTLWANLASTQKTKIPPSLRLNTDLTIFPCDGCIYVYIYVFIWFFGLEFWLTLEKIIRTPTYAWVEEITTTHRCYTATTTRCHFVDTACEWDIRSNNVMKNKARCSDLRIYGILSTFYKRDDIRDSRF